MFKQHERLATSYHMIAGIKILAAFVVFAARRTPRRPNLIADTLRQKWRMWLDCLSLLLSIITVVLGSVLRTYPRDHEGRRPPSRRNYGPRQPTRRLDLNARTLQPTRTPSPHGQKSQKAHRAPA